MNTLQRIDLRLSLAIAVVWGAFVVTSAQADATWDGGGSTTDWSDGTNWVGDVTPTLTSSYGTHAGNLTFSGTVNQGAPSAPITNDLGVTRIGTLTLSNGGWDIHLGNLNLAQIGTGLGNIQATGDSTLRGNFSMGDGDKSITLNGAAGTTTLTIADHYIYFRAGGSAATLTVNGSGNTLLLNTFQLASTLTIKGSANITVNGPVSDTITGNFIWSGSGTFTLNGINTYNCPTYINGGTFALGPSASIDNVPLISIGAGATFDVSAQSSYTLSTNLTARGSNTVAIIKGASGGTVSLGGQTVTLTWSGATNGVDSTHPPLTIEDAELVLNNDPLIVNVPGDPLGEGVYTLISAPGGISGTVISTPTYSGNGQDPALPGTVKTDISISGNSVLLTIAVPPSGTLVIIR